MEVLLNKGFTTLVDEIDAPLALEPGWHVNGHGYVVRGIYSPEAKVTVGQEMLHRRILGLAPADPGVDHRNRTTLDNRRSNLRLATPAQQAQNRGAQRGSRSRYRGVCWHKKYEKWTVQIMLDGQRHYLGAYLTEDEAGAVATAFLLERMPYYEEITL